MNKFYIYDIETLLNIFTFTGKIQGEDTVYVFEISDRINQRQQLLDHLAYLQSLDAVMVGFNSLVFDYPIIHDLLVAPYTFDHNRAYQLCKQIIGRQGPSGPPIRMKDRIIPQLDLFKMNHFNNKAKSTSLKGLEFAMRLASVEDCPVPFDVALSPEQMDQVLSYNKYDVFATEEFLGHCKEPIEMREDLLRTGVLTGDVLNYSDVKIGVEYLIKKIGRGKCFVSGSTPKQSMRSHVDFKNIILSKISYRTEPYQEVLEWFKKQGVWVDRQEKPNFKTKLAGLDFHFGLGGIHASVENKSYESNETHVIKDIDVTGMYVSVAIANGFYPEHLGQEFVTAYTQLQRDRAQYDKGTTMNAVLKLAGNGVYGNSNNSYSCFFDPKYTFSVTVNGQLQLLQLIEFLSLIPGLDIIQANTDGVTVYMPRDIDSFFQLWCREWESLTNLKLEEVEYQNMWIRDVNNYLVKQKDGKIKAKGAYWYPKKQKDYEGWWSKDFSSMVKQKAIEQVLINDLRPKEVVRCVTNPFDFMLRYKTTAGATVYIGDKAMQKTVRYYVSVSGKIMKKRSKPKGTIGDYKRKNKLTNTYYDKIKSQIPVGQWDERINTKNKSKYMVVTTGIQAGRLVKECNRAEDFNWADVDYNYYAEEVEKLIIGSHHV